MTDERKPIEEFFGTPVRRGDNGGKLDHLCGPDGTIRRVINGVGYTLCAMKLPDIKERS
jgi:hypothetical protein